MQVIVMEIYAYHGQSVEGVIAQINDSNTLYEHPRFVAGAETLGELPHATQIHEAAEHFGEAPMADPPIWKQAQVAQALAEGLSADGDLVPKIVRHGGDLLVIVYGMDEPIVVTPEGLSLPAWAVPLAAGIRLDLQAIHTT